MSVRIDETGIAGVSVELQPRFGTETGAVLHMLPGGIANPEGFGQSLLDIYASTAMGRGQQRGGHYHQLLDELFFTLSGSALWILSDFRPDSATYQKTIGLIFSADPLTTESTIATYVITDGHLARLRVPHGVYHTYIPLTDDRVMVVGLGSTPYNKEDYCYPEFVQIPGAAEILKAVNLTVTN